MRTIIFLLFIFTCSTVFGQNRGFKPMPAEAQKQQKAQAKELIKNRNKIPVSVIIPQQTDFNNTSINNLLDNKLKMIISHSGLTGSVSSPRFIIYPKITVIEKELTTTPPIKTVLVLETNLFIADYIDNKIFSSITIKMKGVGNTEEKAYRNALKKLRNTEKIQNFIKSGEARINEYYTTNCDKFIRLADNKANQKQYGDAFEILNNIPLHTDCFNKAQNNLYSIYLDYSNFKCQTNLQAAKYFWGKLDIESTLYYLSNIYPENSCYSEAQTIYNEVKQKVRILEQDYKREIELQRKHERERELKQWELTIKQYEYAVQEQKDKKKFRQKILEKSYELAIEEAKMRNRQRQQTQQNSIIIIR